MAEEKTPPPNEAPAHDAEAPRRGVVKVRPELVVEIAFDGVQASTRYPGGVTLRFARVLRYRPDKDAAKISIRVPEERRAELYAEGLKRIARSGFSA